MDGATTPRGVSAASAAPARTDIATTRPSATPELPPVQTAQPVEAAAVIGPDLPRDNRLAQALEAVERRAMFEEGTRNIVYEWVDRESGDVVGQFPAELALKMRAYWREQERVQAGAEKRDGISA